MNEHQVYTRTPFSLVFSAGTDGLKFDFTLPLMSRTNALLNNFFRSSAKVYEARSREDRHLYAIKRTDQKFKSTADRKRKIEELYVAKRIGDHENLVTYYDAWEEQVRTHFALTETVLLRPSTRLHLERVRKM